MATKWCFIFRCVRQHVNWNMSAKGSNKFYKVTFSTLSRAVLDVTMIVNSVCILLAIGVSVSGAVSGCFDLPRDTNSPERLGIYYQVL